MPHVNGQKVDRGLRNWNFSCQWSIPPFNYACEFNELRKQITTHNNNSWWFMVFNATFNNILTTVENVEYQNK